ncbi:hypothetical protein OUZ56_005632 [Daphnia magna]|uniref:Uncharacterized protein n=1 Tax=Daphnia magna TaxID=35525 RepID=A0ABQ9YTL5_9CRUS|nr:hypothetical protein OUZ56_005632 [Daphnia magna]
MNHIESKFQFFSVKIWGKLALTPTGLFGSVRSTEGEELWEELNRSLVENKISIDIAWGHIRLMNHIEYKSIDKAWVHIRLMNHIECKSKDIACVQIRLTNHIEYKSIDKAWAHKYKLMVSQWIHSEYKNKDITWKYRDSLGSYKSHESHRMQKYKLIASQCVTYSAALTGRIVGGKGILICVYVYMIFPRKVVGMPTPNIFNVAYDYLLKKSTLNVK